MIVFHAAVNGNLWSPIDAYRSNKLSPSKVSSPDKSSREKISSRKSKKSSRETNNNSTGQGSLDPGGGGDAPTEPGLDREETQVTTQSKDGELGWLKKHVTQ